MRQQEHLPPWSAPLPQPVWPVLPKPSVLAKVLPEQPVWWALGLLQRAWSRAMLFARQRVLPLGLLSSALAR